MDELEEGFVTRCMGCGASLTEDGADESGVEHECSGEHQDGVEFTT